jgi:hypothetical protein
MAVGAIAFAVAPTGETGGVADGVAENQFEASGARAAELDANLAEFLDRIDTVLRIEGFAIDSQTETRIDISVTAGEVVAGRSVEFPLLVLGPGPSAIASLADWDSSGTAYLLSDEVTDRWFGSGVAFFDDAGDLLRFTNPTPAFAAGALESVAASLGVSQEKALAIWADTEIGSAERLAILGAAGIDLLRVAAKELEPTPEEIAASDVAAWNAADPATRDLIRGFTPTPIEDQYRTDANIVIEGTGLALTQSNYVEIRSEAGVIHRFWAPLIEENYFVGRVIAVPGRWEVVVLDELDPTLPERSFGTAELNGSLLDQAGTLSLELQITTNGVRLTKISAEELTGRLEQRAALADAVDGIPLE